MQQAKNQKAGKSGQTEMCKIDLTKVLAKIYDWVEILLDHKGRG